jgi:hypothetical protein
MRRHDRAPDAAQEGSGTAPPAPVARDQKGAFMTEPTYEPASATGGSTTEQVKDQVRDKAQAAQQTAQGALGQARSRLRDQADQRSTQAGDQVHATAKDLRGVAEQLRDQGRDTPARVAEQVADRAEAFGSYLRDADGERLLRDVEDFARRQPWLIAAGALALGFATSRFLKASSSRRYQAGPDRSFSDQHLYGAPAATATAVTADPAYTGSDYATEAPFTRADVVAPVSGGDPSAGQAVPPVGELGEPSAGRRDHDPLA